MKAGTSTLMFHTKTLPDAGNDECSEVSSILQTGGDCFLQVWLQSRWKTEAL